MTISVFAFLADLVHAILVVGLAGHGCSKFLMYQSA